MANSKKRCKFCKKYSYVEDMTVYPSGNFCNQDHATLWSVDKVREATEKQFARSKQIKKMKPRDLDRQDLAWQHKQTQKVFNKLRVAEELKWFEDQGLEPTCISCQQPLGNDVWCCGHFKTVGSNGRLRYDKRNTFLQCNKHCNLAKSGNIEGYIIGLIRRFDLEGWNIIEYCDSQNSPLKRTCEELEAMRKDFSKQLRGMQNDAIRD